MKKLFLFLLMGMFLLSFASAFNWSDETIVSYYKMDNSSGVVYDMLGTNDGTNNGATRGVSGKINTAFDFTESGQDYVSFPTGLSSPIASSDELSINVWVKKLYRLTNI